MQCPIHPSIHILWTDTFFLLSYKSFTFHPQICKAQGLEAKSPATLQTVCPGLHPVRQNSSPMWHLQFHPVYHRSDHWPMLIMSHRQWLKRIRSTQQPANTHDTAVWSDVSTQRFHSTRLLQNIYMYSNDKTFCWKIAVYVHAEFHPNQIYVYTCLWTVKAHFSTQFRFTALHKSAVSFRNALSALEKK